MAANTPVVMGPKGVGGSRPGSGAKKGQHRVHVKELKDAIEKATGESFQDIQAKVFLKLFTDFQNDLNIKEFLIFNENMGRRILEQQATEVSVSNASEMSDDEIRERTAALLAKTKTVNDETD